MFVDGERPYDAGVFYCKDAFEGLETMDALQDADRRAPLVTKLMDDARADVFLHAGAGKDIRAGTDDERRSSVRDDHPIPSPAFYGTRALHDIPLDRVFELLDLDELYRLQWGARGSGAEFDRLVREEFEPRLVRLKDRAAAKAGSARKRSTDSFPRSRSATPGRVRPRRLRARRHRHRDRPLRLSPPGGRDASAWPTTSGRWRRATWTSSLSRWSPSATPRPGVRPLPSRRGVHGGLLPPRPRRPPPEAVAEHVHRRHSQGLGLPAGRGQRYSWGYPACPDPRQHELVFRLLNAAERARHGRSPRRASSSCPSRPRRRSWCIIPPPSTSPSREPHPLTAHLDPRVPTIPRAPSSSMAPWAPCSTRAGVFINRCYDELNVPRDPTWCASSPRLRAARAPRCSRPTASAPTPSSSRSYGLSAGRARSTAAAAQLAREAAGDAMRSWSAPSAPWACASNLRRQLGLDEARGAFRRQMRGLLDGGVDGFVPRDLQRPGRDRAGHRAPCVRRSDLPVIAQMTIGKDGLHHLRHRPRKPSRRALDAWGADVVGTQLLGRPAPDPRRPSSAWLRLTDRASRRQPNAGLPREVERPQMYMASPEYMATYARRSFEAGRPLRRRLLRHDARAHPAPSASFVRSASHRAGHASAGAASTARGPDRRAAPHVPLAERSRSGRSWPPASLSPRWRSCRPRGIDPAPMMPSRAVPCKAAGRRRRQRARRPPGTEPHGRAAHRRCSSSSEVGIETVVHYCLPRSQPARHALRPARRRGHRPAQPAAHHRRPAQDGAVSRRHGGLRHRLHRPHQPGRTASTTASTRAATPSASPPASSSAWASTRWPWTLTDELERYDWKVDAGAEYAITQPVFDADAARALPRRASTPTSHPGHRRHLAAGLVRNAEFLANEVPGVSVPEPSSKRMRRATERGKEPASPRASPSPARCSSGWSPWCKASRSARPSAG